MMLQFATSGMAVLEAELQHWQEAGQRPRLFLRDDDAISDTPALRRLIGLCEQHNVPLLLAAVSVVSVCASNPLPERILSSNSAIDRRRLMNNRMPTNKANAPSTPAIIDIELVNRTSSIFSHHALAFCETSIAVPAFSDRVSTRVLVRSLSVVPAAAAG